MRFGWLGLWTLGMGLCCVANTTAQERLIELEFTPTERAQLAIWIERADGTFLRTVRLTSSTSLRGVGNRPGASQMNSGFRWPYGRREGILPIWGWRRATAPEGEFFPRVIFQDRDSEGFAARTSVDASPDNYFCLSFDQTTTTRDALDAVTCASVFSSDKGRFLDEQDASDGYAEPFVGPGGGDAMRELGIRSIYPPRRDIDGLGQFDHPDAALFADEATRVMPEIDAVTMATPAGGQPVAIQYILPGEWEDGEYTLWIEVNVEGDYNENFNDLEYPTPSSDAWDFWAETYGYPYRGQPSVVYSIPFALGPPIAEYVIDGPVGYGSLHGEDGTLTAMDGSIADDPATAPGSGADRLARDPSGARATLSVLETNICSSDAPPPQCLEACTESADCDAGFICGPDDRCTGACDVQGFPDDIEDLETANHPDTKWSHRVGRLGFTIPASARPLRQYEILTSDGTVEDEARTVAFSAEGRPVVGDRLRIPVAEDCAPETWIESLCAPYVADATGACRNGLDIDGDGDCLDPGDRIEVDIAFDRHETRYELEMSALDVCQGRSSVSQTALTTSRIDFTTVPPCFVATAAYGSPLADEIWALRRFRDRYLMTHSAGRAFVDLYYAWGPYAADFIAEHPWLRTTTRVLLTPLVGLARHLTESDENPAPSL
ncbi:MAG: CFI-box-CTERM domain-containing protein [Polyangiales bacterium]